MRVLLNGDEGGPKEDKVRETGGLDRGQPGSRVKCFIGFGRHCVYLNKKHNGCVSGGNVGSGRFVLSSSFVLLDICCFQVEEILRKR